MHLTLLVSAVLLVVGACAALRLPRAMECAPRDTRPTVSRDAQFPARPAASAAVRSGRASD
jgi:DHA2 family multidrug resistance protein-like MFS transporter